MIRERILVFILVISALMYLANISQALTFDFENADQEEMDGFSGYIRN